MNKAELIEKVVKEAGISTEAAKAALTAVLDGIVEGIRQGDGKFTIAGFGTFKANYRQTIMGVYPQIPRMAAAGDANRIYFRPSKRRPPS